MKLRIISGELKGRFIQAPASKGTRPTTDRVRETLFNILNNYIDFDSIKVLDLYSGSGSLGFECISRGAEMVHFTENNYKVYNNLKNNSEQLGVNERCMVFKTDAAGFTASCEESYDLILADPPFFKYDIYKAVENILERELLEDDGMMIIERSIQTEKKDIEGLNIEAFKRIGDTLLYRIT